MATDEPLVQPADSLFQLVNRMVYDRTSPLWHRYLAAILLAGIASVLRWQLLGVFEFRGIFVTFYPAVAAAALYGGFGPGLTATIVSAVLADYLFIFPLGQFGIPEFAHRTSLAIFIFSGALISYLAEAASRAQLRVEHKADELRNLNRTLRALSNTIRATTQASDLLELMNAVCRIIADDCGHPMVWIGLAENDENKTVSFVAQVGLDDESLKSMKITWSDSELGRGPAGTAIRTGRPYVCGNMFTDPRLLPWREQVTARGCASCAALPLTADGATLGVLTIYAREPDYFSDDKVKLLTELADNLAFGIKALRVRLAHREAEKELRESRARLDLALRSAGMGTWHWDSASNRLYFDEQASYLLGMDPAKATDAKDWIFRLIHADDRQTVRRALVRTMKQDVPFEAEHRIVRAGGKVTHVAARGKLAHDDQGRTERLNGLVWDITERRQMEDELRRSHDELELRVGERTADLKAANEKLRQVPSRLIEAQERERQRLSMELHDSVGQTIAALKFRIEHVIAGLENQDNLHALELLHEFVPVLQRSLDETRAIYMGLRPTILAEHGIVATLDWYRRELLMLYPNQHIELETRINEADIPEDFKIAIFRIAQEALINSFKHGHPEWVDVRLALNDGAVELEISDDGIGMDLDYIMESRTAKSLGLIGMRERAELTGGEFTITSAPDKGTTVKAVWRDQRG